MTDLKDTLAALSECPCCGAPCEVTKTPAWDHRWTDENGQPQRTHHHAIERFTYRSGQLVPVPSVERVARAIHEAESGIPWEVTTQQDIALNRATAVLAVMEAEGRAAMDAVALLREIEKLRKLIQAMADDYQVSAKHHPNHVLVTREAFEAAIAAMKGEGRGDG